MPTTGHYLKPGVRSTAPCSVFSLVIDPTVTIANHEGNADWWTFGIAHVACVRYKEGKWTSVKGATCESPAQLWSWMEERADSSKRNYVFSPNAGDALTLSEWWVRAEAGGVIWEPQASVRKGSRTSAARDGVSRIRRWVCTPTTTILDYSRDGLRWLWVNGKQYFDCTERELSLSLEIKCETRTAEDADGSWYGMLGKDKCLLWLSAVIQLADWWRVNSRAPFALTGSGLSMGILRSHVAPKAICTHDDPDAHRLEREASFGGRASCWYFGDIGQPNWHDSEDNPAPSRSSYPGIPGPLHHVDVRSMYPWLLRERDFPTHRISYRDEVSVGECYDFSRDYATICRVTIETEQAEYPYRDKGEITYPVGRFQTCLTGPEILHLRKHGKVVKCHSMATYRKGRPFAGAAGAMIDLRELSRKAGNKAWEHFAKLMGNGMGGKLAQRKGVWEQRPKVVPESRWGTWIEANGTRKKSRKYRAVAGMTWEYVEDAYGAGPFTFAFAYLTAWGRLHMAGLRALCPAESVVSMDTDGLWVTDEGLAALTSAGKVGGDTAGCLAIKPDQPAARFLGPRHYWLPTGWVLSGYHSPSVQSRAVNVRDTVRWNPLNGQAVAPPVAIRVKGRTSTLPVVADGLQIGKDGWASARRKG